MLRLRPSLLLVQPQVRSVPAGWDVDTQSEDTRPLICWLKQTKPRSLPPAALVIFLSIIPLAAAAAATARRRTTAIGSPIRRPYRRRRRLLIGCAALLAGTGGGAQILQSVHVALASGRQVLVQPRQRLLQRAQRGQRGAGAGAAGLDGRAMPCAQRLGPAAGGRRGRGSAHQVRLVASGRPAGVTERQCTRQVRPLSGASEEPPRLAEHRSGCILAVAQLGGLTGTTVMPMHCVLAPTATAQAACVHVCALREPSSRQQFPASLAAPTRG